MRRALINGGAAEGASMRGDSKTVTRTLEALEALGGAGPTEVLEDSRSIAPLTVEPPTVSLRLLAPAVCSPWERYEDLGLIGRGGMGEVRRVRDRVMGRILAMKLLPAEQVGDAVTQARFLAEARLTACLQHPGIVPVHECGALPDGRLWFAMKEVRGRTLEALIHPPGHAGARPEPTVPSPEALRRLLDVYLRVCEAVAYAHGRGVLHRDLKPENVMVGEFGEVLVMDWGIARVATEGELAIGTLDGARLREGAPTEAGIILGTLRYMPPEQARGQMAGLQPSADVYALGAILYEMLCGSPPYEGPTSVVWALVTSVAPAPLAKRCGGQAPLDLIAICERAMARKADERHADAGVLAGEIRSFLDGARRRDRARALVAEALALAPAFAELQARARALRREAQAVLKRAQSFDPVEKKARGWALEDEAGALDREAAVQETVWHQRMRAALDEAPDLEEAHAVLAERYRDDLLAAEEARDVAAAARAETLLRQHDRGQHAALLSGHGALTLVTEPEGAEVWCSRFVEQQRRLHLEPERLLGRTPLRALTLPRGSYLLRLRAPGFREVRYPVSLGRGEHWDGVRPGRKSPFAVPLLPDGALGDDDVYVPAGWFLVGGDPLASESLPGRRVWVDGFVLQRHPVTQAEFLAFLNALIDDDQEALALAACPRAAQPAAGATDVPLLKRDRQGRFRFGPRTPADHGRHPIVSIDWHAARAYAAWWAARTGRPWRLPGEVEREKAARGVDGRFFPWGNQPEHTWACMVGSRPGAPHPEPVDTYPIDESPYGTRGNAGNVRDWCAEVWTPEGPEAPGGILRAPEAIAAAAGQRSIRGGAWGAAPPALCRVAGRFAAFPEERHAGVGLRLAWSIGA
jgi:eukaryotic-like serine/threonine-protein kinase